MKKYDTDQITHDMYGDESLWFVFQLRNMDVIKDPIFDFKTGKKIYIPIKKKCRKHEVQIIWHLMLNQTFCMTLQVILTSSPYIWCL